MSGSALVMANTDTILAAGDYNKTDDKDLSTHEQTGFTNLELSDSAVQLSILYIPDRRIKLVNIRLFVRELAKAEQIQKESIKEDEDEYCLGYYYLAFGLVFMMVFLFSREKTENLYFSLFCLFAAFTNIGFAQSTYLGCIIALFSFVFMFDVMSFFLAKVLRNKNKSRISLIVRLVISAICFHPALLYRFRYFGHTAGHFNNVPTPLAVLAVFGILFCISGASCFYYLFRGFKQKRWEAKTILYVCLLALFLSSLFSGLASLIPGLDDSVVVDKISGMGIYLYPLSAVIVLGRTNRLNQRKLMDQVLSIKQLSDQNLEKEKEKQQILESQNEELEQKVVERTRDINKQKEEIEQKKQEIELKNKAITDNINYAQRIQSAILPDVKLIYRALEQSFILFVPKDIVSGDFYSFAEKNDRVLIIAGDCTGHGVSGAFMSMIGSSLLNQIINEKGITEPALILNQLNSSVIEALKQGENESNDGMDVSICSFDLLKRELQYAGANRPLWLIRNRELQVFRPDKFPIGGLQMARSRTFTNYSIELQPGDALYIFTDGFADQFGGEHGKKLMTGRFKELLLGIQDKDMRAQEQYLRNYFDEWKVAHEQVDDVLVIGVRV